MICYIIILLYSFTNKVIKILKMLYFYNLYSMFIYKIKNIL